MAKRGKTPRRPVTPAPSPAPAPARRPRLGLWLGVLALAAALAAAGAWLAAGRKLPPAPPATPAQSEPAPATFLGSAACAQCHPKETGASRGSQHQRAMQAAVEGTVLGNFDDARFTHGGVTSTFFRRDGRYFVNTDSPDGKLSDFEVRYTFGVAPLQQYLVELPGGRLQALGIAWDARPKAEGGQRWFHLYRRMRGWPRRWEFFLELSGRKGHCLTNGHVARTALATGALLAVNADDHEPRDFMTAQRAECVALGAGLSAVDYAQLRVNMASLVARL